MHAVDITNTPPGYDSRAAIDDRSAHDADGGGRTRRTRVTWSDRGWVSHISRTGPIFQAMFDILRRRSGAWVLAVVALALTACGPSREAKSLRGACEGGDADACNVLGFNLVLGYRVLHDIDRGVALLEQACDAGVGEGCVRLGRTFQSGLRDASVDSARAATFYQRACDRGMVQGCLQYGLMLQTGWGVERDLARAAALLQGACDADTSDVRPDDVLDQPLAFPPRRSRSVMESCSSLGTMYRDGSGVAADAGRAADLFRTACDAEYALGCSQLGSLYADGSGVARDMDRALELQQQACDTDGGLVGCIRLGDYYADGAGVEQDYARADSLYRHACDRRNGEACYKRGDLYATGTGVARDLSRAARLFRRACFLGYEEACRRQS